MKFDTTKADILPTKVVKVARRQYFTLVRISDTLMPKLGFEPVTSDIVSRDLATSLSIYIIFE